MLTYVSAKSQKWQPGTFTDVKGNIETGFIRTNPPGKGPIRNEGFIEFKENEKANPYKLSASDIIHFVAGQDSFVVAHAPQNETWAKEETDFVMVVLDEDLKLYATKGDKVGGRGFGISPDVGVGIGAGSGGYSGFGGGIGLSFGGGGGRSSSRLTYYYGDNAADMKHLTDENFEDIMVEIMGDEPEVVEKIHEHQYTLKNIDKLVAYFKQTKKSPSAP